VISTPAAEHDTNVMINPTMQTMRIGFGIQISPFPVRGATSGSLLVETYFRLETPRSGEKFQDR